MTIILQPNDISGVQIPKSALMKPEARIAMEVILEILKLKKLTNINDPLTSVIDNWLQPIPWYEMQDFLCNGDHKNLSEEAKQIIAQSIKDKKFVTLVDMIFNNLPTYSGLVITNLNNLPDESLSDDPMEYYTIQLTEQGMQLLIDSREIQVVDGEVRDVPKALEAAAAATAAEENQGLSGK